MFCGGEGDEEGDKQEGKTEEGGELHCEGRVERIEGLLGVSKECIAVRWK